MKEEEAVKVYARPRPKDIGIDASESKQECIILREEDGEVWLRPQNAEQQKWCPAGDQNFTFDKVFSDVNVSQETVYKYCAEEVVTAVLSGYNGTVMAYGQTGAGKTYTMSGKVGWNKQVDLNVTDSQHKGVMQRAVDQVFKVVTRSNAVASSKQDQSEVLDEVDISYIEIYNDIVIDLLQEEPRMGTSERKESTNDRGFGNISRLSVKSRDHALELMRVGLKRRQVAGHNLNRDSSRSHAIFTIYLRRTFQKANSASAGEKKTESIHSRLDLVDLAGSERLSKTQSSGSQQAEAQHINKSLSFLEQVIIAIGDPNREHIPYRTCKLTQFLKESLGGNSYARMITNIRTEQDFLSETIRTCRFAQRMLRVKNQPILNVLRDDKDISRYMQKLMKENNHLKEELALYDSLSQRKIAYEPYNNEQRANVREQVVKYFQSDSWDVNDFAPLDFVSIRHIKEIVLQCKTLYKKTYPEELQNLEIEADITKYLVKKDGPPSNAGDANQSNVVHFASESHFEAIKDDRKENKLRTSQEQMLDPVKIEAYRQGTGKKLQDALDENRALLKAKKKEANTLAKKMNDLIKRIKSNQDTMECTPEETQDMKSEYRELHQERAMVLSEVEHCQNLINQCSKELHEGVNQCLQ